MVSYVTGTPVGPQRRANGLRRRDGAGMDRACRPALGIKIDESVWFEDGEQDAGEMAEQPDHY